MVFSITLFTLKTSLGDLTSSHSFKTAITLPLTINFPSRVSACLLSSQPSECLLLGVPWDFQMHLVSSSFIAQISSPLCNPVSVGDIIHPNQPRSKCLVSPYTQFVTDRLSSISAFLPPIPSATASVSSSFLPGLDAVF